MDEDLNNWWWIMMNKRSGLILNKYFSSFQYKCVNYFNINAKHISLVYFDLHVLVCIFFSCLRILFKLKWFKKWFVFYKKMLTNLKVIDLNIITWIEEGLYIVEACNLFIELCIKGKSNLDRKLLYSVSKQKQVTSRKLLTIIKIIYEQ